MSIDPHVESRLSAFLDGELSEHEATRVRAHCETCETCGRALAELKAVAESLESDPARRPLSPMWPDVERSLRRHFLPRFDLPFAAATAFAVAAGFMIGMLAFKNEAAPVSASSGSAATVIQTEAEVSLADLYFFEAANEEGTP